MNKFFFTHFFMLVLIGGCFGQTNLYILNNATKAELIVLPGSKNENRYIIDKNPIVNIDAANNLVFVTASFRNLVDSLNLGAAFFKLVFYDKRGNALLTIHSFSAVSSFRDINAKPPYIYFDKDLHTYIPDNKLIIHW